MSNAKGYLNNTNSGWEKWLRNLKRELGDDFLMEIMDNEAEYKLYYDNGYTVAEAAYEEREARE